MDSNAWLLPFVAATLGSGGLSGIVVSVANRLGRRDQAKKVEELSAALAGIPPNTSGHDAIGRALQLEALALASMSLVRGRYWLVVLIPVVVGPLWIGGWVTLDPVTRSAFQTLPKSTAALVLLISICIGSLTTGLLTYWCLLLMRRSARRDFVSSDYRAEELSPEVLRKTTEVAATESWGKAVSWLFGVTTSWNRRYRRSQVRKARRDEISQVASADARRLKRQAAFRRRQRRRKNPKSRKPTLRTGHGVKGGY